MKWATADEEKELDLLRYQQMMYRLNDEEYARYKELKNNRKRLVVGRH